MLLDDRVVRSCLVLAAQANGREVITVEGLEDDPDGRRLQDAFCARHALQCGYCTPGVLIGLVGLLRESPTPSPEELIEALAGSLCRCTGYTQILEAVRDVIEQPR